jgi:signal transduction histidine kinase
MKLLPKLALALLAGVFLVVAAFTSLRVHSEIRLFDKDVRRDQRLIASTAAALARSLTREEALRVADRVDASREDVKVRFVSLGVAPPPGLRALIEPPGGRVLQPGAWIQLVQRLEPSGPEYLLTYAGAPVLDDPHGAIELAESLAARSTYISQGVWSVVISGFALLAVCFLIVASIGARMVGQPVAELTSAVRRISAGEFDVLQNIDRSDEFGELARALRSMSMALATARERTKQEADARIRAAEQVQHAERLATLGKLASVLAHEIGTPLNVIAGHAKMLATGRVRGDAASESSSEIVIQCERMTQIVRRILDYARRRRPRRIRVRAKDVVMQSRDLLASLAAERNVLVRFQATETEDALFADPDQIRQAVTNLLINAIHASRAGSEVELTVGRGTRDGRGFVVITVQDQGAGIGPAERTRIFEPFFTTKQPGEGTGLGLSVVSDIVQEHEGLIDWYSEEGKGSTFHIFLPDGHEGRSDGDSRPSH